MDPLNISLLMFWKSEDILIKDYISYEAEWYFYEVWSKWQYMSLDFL